MDNDADNSSHHLPLGGVLGITIGGAVIFLGLVVLLACKARSRKKKRESALVMDFTDITHASRKNTLDVSWRKTDDEHHPRPVSNDSKTSYQFDASALKNRENSGRLSYDTPYSTIQRPEADQVQVQRQQQTNSLDRGRRIVSGYGQVAIISPGYLVDNDRPESVLYSVPHARPQNGFIVQGQGQSGRLPSYSSHSVPAVEMRHSQPSERTGRYPDSFRSSVGVDLGANTERGPYHM